MPDPRPATTEEIIQGYAKMYGVPPDLALAVANRESQTNPDVPPGDRGKAIGMFQLHEGAALDTDVDRNDPIQNIIGGVKYLRQLADQFGNDTEKVLQAYNGGASHVVAGDVSPEAQAYATQVMSKMLRGAATTKTQTQTQTAKPRFTDQSVPVTTQPPPFAESLQVLPGITMGNVKGFAKGAGETVTRLGEMVRKRFPSLAVGPEVTFSTEATTPEQQAGKSAERIAEFLGASELAGGATATAPLLTKAAAQAATGYGVSKAQGASEVGSRINAALGAYGPVIGEAIPVVGQTIRNRAIRQLALRLTKGLEESGPLVRHAVKTGDVAPDALQGARIVNQAASEILDAPLRLTWGKWQTELSKDAAQKGEKLAEAVKGPLGQEMIFKQPIVDELNKFADQYARMEAEIAKGARGGQSDIGQVTHNEDLMGAINVLKNKLDEFGPMISVKNLSTLKRTWDDVVYTLNTAGKVGLGSEALLNSAKKRAADRGADAIRAALYDKFPKIGELNEAVSHAYRLQDLVDKLYKASPGMNRLMSSALHTTSAVAGAAIGGELGGHPLYGILAGGGVASALQRAFESPLWQTLKPTLKSNLADAIASGNTRLAMKILQPLLQAETAKTTAVH